MKEIKELLMVKLIPEILDDCDCCTTREAVKNILLKNNSPALRNILYFVFNPDQIFDVVVPEKWSPDPNPIGLSPNSLYTESRRLYIFTTKKLLPAKHKTQLIKSILESVYITEAELVLQIFNKDLGIELLTYDLVEETFPGLLPKQQQLTVE